MTYSPTIRSILKRNHLSTKAYAPGLVYVKFKPTTEMLNILPGEIGVIENGKILIAFWFKPNVLEKIDSIYSVNKIHGKTYLYKSLMELFSNEVIKEHKKYYMEVM